MQRANAKEPDLVVDGKKSVFENFAENQSMLNDLDDTDRDFLEAYQKLATAMRADLLSGTAVDKFPDDENFGREALS